MKTYKKDLVGRVAKESLAKAPTIALGACYDSLYFMVHSQFSGDELKQQAKDKIEDIISILRDRPFDERLQFYKFVLEDEKRELEYKNYKRVVLLRDFRQEYLARVLD